MKQVVQLGDRLNGETEIVALNVDFVEKPATFKYAKYSTYKSIYLEVTQDVLREIDAFYSSIKAGDLSEGIANAQPYYKILGVKYYDGMFQQNMSYEELVQRWEFWSPYMNLPDEWANISFIIEIV